jgi:hypothetical protein
MTFLGVTFAICALVMFIVAFVNLFKGKVGTAVGAGVVALILSGVSTAVFVV